MLCSSSIHLEHKIEAYYYMVGLRVGFLVHRPRGQILLQASNLDEQIRVKISPMVENMALSKTIEIHSLTKKMERDGLQVLYKCCCFIDHHLKLSPDNYIARRYSHYV